MAFNIDSSQFNSSAYFKQFIKDKSLVEIIEKNNALFTESKQIENDLQTMVYENYSKFIQASDTISSIKHKMTDLDTDLLALKDSLTKVNQSYGRVEGTLKAKWREVVKLDTMEKDLNKLKYLSELPNLFKGALNAYQAQLSKG